MLVLLSSCSPFFCAKYSKKNEGWSDTQQYPCHGAWVAQLAFAGLHAATHLFMWTTCTEVLGHLPIAPLGASGRTDGVMALRNTTLVTQWQVQRGSNWYRASSSLPCGFRFHRDGTTLLCFGASRRPLDEPRAGLLAAARCTADWRET
jgi:hypothetical protein